MYYLSACNRGLFKSWYCYVLFLPFKKFSKYYEKYSWLQNSMLTNIRNKCVLRKINLYFLTLWKMAKLFLQKFVIFNMITNPFLVEKWGTLERARRYVCKNLLNLDCQDSVCFNIYQVANKGRIIWEEFLLPIFCKTFW